MNKKRWLILIVALFVAVLPNRIKAEAETVIGEIPLNQEFTPENSGYYSFTIEECSSVRRTRDGSDCTGVICSGDNFYVIAYSKYLRLAPGEYYIYLSNYNDKKTKILVTPESSASYEQENNDSFDQANVINTNIAYTGNSHQTKQGSYSCDMDYYKFNIAQMGSVYIDCRLESIWSADYTFSLYSEDADTLNTTLISKFRCGNVVSESNKLRLPVGNYYVKVSSERAWGDSEDYSFKVNYTAETSETAEQEYNDTPETANTIKINSPYTGNIMSSSDVDYYKVILDSTGMAKLKMTIPRQTTDAMFKASLYKEGDLKTAVDTVKTTTNPTAFGIEKNLSAGTYYIKVEGGNDSVDSHKDYDVELVFDKTSLVTSIELSAGKETFYPGDTAKITATVLPANASNKDLEWSSSDKSVVTVDSAGNITCVAKGKAYIKAKAKDASKVQAQLLITVTDRLVTDIQVNAEKETLEIGDTVKVKAVVSPSNATKKSYYWASSNEDIATVSDNGVVKAKKAGKVEISAIAEDGSKVKGSVILTIKKSQSSNCNLSGLKLSTGSLSKSFSSSQKSYTLVLNKNKSNVKITPVVSDKNSTITINGRSAKSVTIAVKSKKSTTVKIKVKAEDGSEKEYAVVVKRK